jgi:hypothetical protein
MLRSSDYIKSANTGTVLIAEVNESPEPLASMAVTAQSGGFKIDWVPGVTNSNNTYKLEKRYSTTPLSLDSDWTPVATTTWLERRLAAQLVAYSIRRPSPFR